MHEFDLFLRNRFFSFFIFIIKVEIYTGSVYSSHTLIYNPFTMLPAIFHTLTQSGRIDDIRLQKNNVV